MGGGDTKTGGVLERMVIPALEYGGYLLEMQVAIGLRPSGRKHVVDIVAQQGTYRYAISLKWQQVSGTAEQKVPFEVICLADAVIHRPELTAAYLVLGGDGWTLREFYIRGGLAAHLMHPELVRIKSLEQFIALANRGKL